MVDVQRVEAGWRLSARSGVPAEQRERLGGDLPATVPGAAHTDLVAAGLIDDIAVTGLEADQDWVQDVDWSFTTTVDASGATGAVRELVLEGLDTLATVLVDGREVLRSTDMFHSHVLDVTDAGDSFELRVDFDAAMPEAGRREAEIGELPRPYWFPYNYLRKMACSYGWDWGPTTATSGIWRPVTLRSWSDARLAEIDVRPGVVDGVPTVDLAVSTQAAPGTSPDGLTVRATLAGSTSELVLAGGTGSTRLQDASLALWWPRGYGEAALHDLVVELLAPDGSVLDRDERRVGFRTVELDQTPDAEGRTFALVVNGRRVWVRGFNWIPDDPFPHRVDRARYADRIQHAVEANANLLRVWGGGRFESDDFYDECDERGLLVWQDFLFACAAYDEDEQQVREVTQEVTQNVERLRHRASLALWCGGNECLEGHEHWGWQPTLDGRPWGEHYYRTLLPERVAALDCTRPYIPGSPFTNTPDGDPQDSRDGTIHIWTTWGMVDYEYYEWYRPRFVAEFGYQAPASYPTLLRATGSTELDPTSPVLQSHQKALGEDKLALGLQRHFFDAVTDPRAWYFGNQLIQARAVSLGIPHFRSQFERCSGTVWWQLNDCWPSLSWAVLDVAGERRLGYHAIRDAYADRIAVLSAPSGDMRLTLVNDSDESWQATARVRHEAFVGGTLAEGEHTVVVAPRSAERLLVADVTGRRVDASMQELVVVDVPGAPRVTRASRPDRAIVALQPQLVSATAEQRGDAVVVTAVAGVLLRDLSLLAELRGFGYRVEGQLATLVAGETHEFTVHRTDRAVTVDELGDLDELLWSDNRVRDISAAG